MTIRTALAIMWTAVLLGGAVRPVLGQGQGPSLRPPMVSPEVERAIKHGLAYLGRTQGRNGAWRSRGLYGDYPCAMTALAGVAMLAGGHTPVEGQYATNVRRAIEYVLSCAGPNGLISRPEEEMRPMYGHGFGMLFLAEVYGMQMDPAEQEKIRRVLQRAVRLTGQSQSKAGGWIYTPDAGGDEGSVTVTQIQGLRAIRNAGINVPKMIIERACAYIENSANPDGSIRYRVRDRGGSRPAITAAAVATMYNAGQYENPVALRALGYIKKLLKTSKTSRFAGGHHFYAMLYTAQAMYLSDDANWRMYFPRVRDELLGSQAENGSWYGDRIGETYGTSIALIILQLPYRYLPIVQR